MDQNIVIDGVVLSPKAIKALKDLQEDNNNSITIFQKNLDHAVSDYMTGSMGRTPEEIDEIIHEIVYLKTMLYDLGYS